jgi:hypothetical protein
MSNIKNIEVDQGTSYSYVLTLTNSNNAIYDLTGYDARLQVRRNYGDTTVLINATLQNSKLSVNAAAGKVTFTLAPSDTSGIRFDLKDDDTLECVYDLEIISPTGNVYKPAKGTFTIRREVTR